MIRKCAMICSVVMAIEGGLVADAMPMYWSTSPSYVRPMGPRSPRHGGMDPYSFAQRLSPIHERIFSQIFDEEERGRAMRIADFIMREDPENREYSNLAVEIVVQLAGKPMMSTESEESGGMSSRFHAPSSPPPRTTTPPRRR